MLLKVNKSILSDAKFASVQLVDKSLQADETFENQVRFCESEFVGVRWYVRTCFRKKRIRTPF